MLKAKPSKHFESLFAIYNKNLIKRRFDSLNVRGLEHLTNVKNLLSLIIYANHSSWWDGLIVFQILKKLPFQCFYLMEDQHLKNFPLFRRLGGFSIVRENPRDSVKGINYAANLLKENTNNLLVIFPQGKILPNDLRPINFQNGVSRIIEKTEKCLITSLAIKIEFAELFKPQIFVRIEATEKLIIEHPFDSKKNTVRLAENLTVSLDQLKTDILNGNTIDYQNLL